MNTRTYHLEDAARLAMGNFIADDTSAVARPVGAILKAAGIGIAVGVIALSAWAYLA